MSAGVRRVTVSNCIFNGTLRGLRVKTARGRGGIVEDILAENIIMENVSVGISLDMYYEGLSDVNMPVTEQTPFLKNIRYFNIIGKNIKQAMNISGLPEAPIDGLTLQNIYMQSEEGVNIAFIKNISMINVELEVKKGSAFSLKRSEDVLLDNLISRSAFLSIPVIKLKDSKNVLIRNCRAIEGTTNFLKAEHTLALELINDNIGKAIIERN
jgi:polygalacturonase